jgi:hypothetical protein
MSISCRTTRNPVASISDWHPMSSDGWTHRIAVKVINHLGDEVTDVFRV